MRRPPMVAVIGRKHSGKTTLLTRLAAELHDRGHRVMTIKHGSHTFNVDPATTDTYRHYHEGRADKVAMVSPDKFALIERWSDELGPEEIAERYMEDADVVLCEGFKKSSLPKIEIHRVQAHAEPLYEPGSPDAAHYLVIVTDASRSDWPVPVIQLDEPRWLSALTELVERRIMGLLETA
ncbi:MAG: molybdopterin-guanine dinucleotide biosynthesis protein B [Gemmatimonadota bacterium]|nr:molybdopterin-guanine dinucleotide biosynthesis protein B [Gemmatimonadota bacterium]